jgi:hypothetical protein
MFVVTRINSHLPSEAVSWDASQGYSPHNICKLFGPGQSGLIERKMPDKHFHSNSQSSAIQSYSKRETNPWVALWNLQTPEYHSLIPCLLIV